MIGPETEFLIVAIMTIGTGAIFFWHDRRNSSSTVLAICMFAIGLRLLMSGTDRGYVDGLFGWLVQALTISLEAVAMLAGVEWGKRIGQTAPKGASAATRGLFIASQILILVYWGLALGYLAIFPEQAVSDAAGVVRMRGVEFAVFAPVLGTGILLAGIAIATLRISKIDPAEVVRLRALSIAGPFLLAALVFGGDIIPITLTLGLLVFLSGSVRYLIIQAERGQFMRQFLSPEVAHMAQDEGTSHVLQRERRELSVVICDLRGFTAYAQNRDSDEVVALLEQFYKVVGAVAEEHGGTVKDHAGDGVLILVGAPIKVDDHALQATRLAMDLVAKVHDMLMQQTEALGIGAGVATGLMTVGAIQGAGRLEYVAVGESVNLAARLSDRAKDGEVLLDNYSFHALPPNYASKVTESSSESLKGFAKQVPVFSLKAGQFDSINGVDPES